MENLPVRICHWFVVWNMNFIFPHIGKFITPTDELRFFRGVGKQTTNQVISSAWQVPSTMFRTKIWKDCHLCRPQLQQFAEKICSHRTLRISRYIMIYPRRTFGHFFLPSAPRQPHRYFHPEVCKTRQIYIDVGIFISRCFLCSDSDIILCLSIFTRKLGGKTWNLGGKKRNWAEFCSKHFSALNNMTRPYKKLSASAFFLGL